MHSVKRMQNDWAYFVSNERSGILKKKSLTKVMLQRKRKLSFIICAVFLGKYNMSTYASHLRLDEFPLPGDHF